MRTSKGLKWLQARKSRCKGGLKLVLKPRRVMVTYTTLNKARPSPPHYPPSSAGHPLPSAHKLNSLESNANKNPHRPQGPPNSFPKPLIRRSPKCNAKKGKRRRRKVAQLSLFCTMLTWAYLEHNFALYTCFGLIHNSQVYTCHLATFSFWDFLDFFPIFLDFSYFWFFFVFLCIYKKEQKKNICTKRENGILGSNPATRGSIKGDTWVKHGFKPTPLRLRLKIGP